MIPIHPVAEVFPPMTAEEFGALKADIAANGVREPAWLHGGAIIDGRNRARACEELGVPLPTREWDGNGSMVAFVVSQNMHRRHLTPAQKATLAVEIEPLFADETKKRQAQGCAIANENTLKNSLPVILPEANSDSEENDTVSDESVPKITCRADREARGMAAKATGSSPRYVSDAKRIKAADPELFDKVKAGTLTIPQAIVEVKRQEKRVELKAKADAAPVDAAPSWEIIRGEVGTDADPLANIAPGSVQLVFADPPYNIGFDYGEGHDDEQPAEQYLAWCERWLNRCADLVAPDGSMWVLINDEYAAEYAVALKRTGLVMRNWVKWYETFGINCSDKFNRTSRHLFYFVRDPKRCAFYPDAVTRPSVRQLIGDARANPSGKLMDDVWTDIPRLAGGHTERMPDFPTQLPVALLRRIVACCAAPGDLVVDPFNGSGTTGVAAIERGCRYVGIERSAKFAELASLRLKGVKRGDAA